MVAREGGTLCRKDESDSIAEAVREIINPKLLPELIRLAEICTTPHFNDKSVRSLYSCLLDAIVNCGADNFSYVYGEMEALRESAEEYSELVGFSLLHFDG